MDKNVTREQVYEDVAKILVPLIRKRMLEKEQEKENEKSASLEKENGMKPKLKNEFCMKMKG